MAYLVHQQKERDINNSAVEVQKLDSISPRI